jgi:8-oxo-dGTP pyrophosphatase MutT (NUDIX family)
MFIVNVEGAVHRHGKWLIIERSLKEEQAAGALSLAGGKADQEAAAEDILEETVKRELYEEVGIEIKGRPQYISSSCFIGASGAPVINVVFLCEYERGEASCKSPDEVEAVYWMSAEEVVNHPKSPPWTIQSLRAAEQALGRQKGGTVR